MSPSRIILIVLGVFLLGVALPLLFMSGMMAMMMGPGLSWGMAGFTLVLIALGVGLLAAGLWRR